MPRSPSIPRDVSGEAPFLAAIRAEPDSDLPRLVFADWLEERGDPRGEFIRLQCQLEQLTLSAPERDDLEAREAALLAAHQQRWLAELEAVAGVEWMLEPYARRIRHGVLFRRGFVAGAIFSTLPAIQRHLDRLIAQYGLRCVHFPLFSQRLAGALAKRAALSQVEEFTLHDDDALAAVLAQPRPGGLRALTFWPRSEVLDPATVQRLATAEQAGRLRRLNLRAWSPGKLLAPLFAAGRGLELESCELEVTDLRPLLDVLREAVHVERLTDVRLRELMLVDRAQRQVALAAFLRSPARRRLERLGLCLYDMTGVAESIADSKAPLVDLRLEVHPGVGVTLRDLEPLFSAGNLAGLRQLRLAGEQAGDGLVSALAGSTLRELRHLELRNCRLTEAGVKGLLEDPAFETLRTLSLPDTYIGDAALRTGLRERFPANSFL